ncbi:hypothetical protein DIDNDMLP_00213 [Klebsiella phage KP13-7]|nr:hypothetical protein DIDNDMLP_00213 [Klebsiella phage KP13-7]
MRRKTQEEFIIDAKRIRTDVEFDYSKTVYINNRTKIIIIDPQYGEFLIKPNSFLSMKQGHPERGKNKRIKSKTCSTEKFIQKAKSKRMDVEYDYSKVQYEHNRKSICIIDPDYGEFYITPNLFLQGGVHPDRGITNRSNTEKFIEKAKKVQPHINYDYSKVDYKNNKTKVIIIDPDYGEFEIRPDSFLQGKGHPVRGLHCQHYSYIHTIEYENEIIGLKYGIENIKGKRVKEQNCRSIYYIKHHTSYYFESINDCKNAEKECKQIFGKGIIQKENMKDGYTETTYAYNFNKIIEIYERFGGIKI